jgi:hypothetical protein
MNSVKPLDKINSVSHTQFDPTTGIVQIPVIEIPEVATGEIKTYRAELQLVPDSSPMRFTVKLLESKPH